MAAAGRCRDHGPDGRPTLRPAHIELDATSEDGAVSIHVELDATRWDEELVIEEPPAEPA